jgi:DNA polymerase-3 subunit epsilon/ATP-dependent DNA helicase DinG
VDREWSSLINPGRPLPPFITQLTGIDDSMLAGAPRMRDVVDQLRGFVGEDPILGHQVEFDLSFLRRRGLFADNSALDTYDLASVVLPDADRYSLASLAAALAIPVRTSHRALDDARATMQVYQRLFSQLLELPPELLQQLAALAPEVDWSGGWILEDALDQLVESGVSLPKPELRPWAEFPPPGQEFPALKPAAERRQLDIEGLAAALEPGGAMAQAFPGYEHRTQQVKMLSAVAAALSQGQHLLVEAGTGTGKSMAYMIPAFAWAQTNGERVLVSTNTLNLQDQLIYKDVPDLRRAWGRVSAAVLKARQLPVSARFNAAGWAPTQRKPGAGQVMVWLHQGGSGDVGEITLRGPAEAGVWSRLASDASECSMEACMLHTGGICPYYRARRAAESAHVVIVNHALLLADITTGNRVIPDYQHLIVDEAHHLESATTRGLSFQVSEGELLRSLRELGGPEAGLLGRLVRLAQRELEAQESGRVKAAVMALSELAGECLERSPGLFSALSAFLERKRDGRPLGRYGQQERVVPSTRTLPEWSVVEIAWEELRDPMGQVASG